MSETFTFTPNPTLKDIFETLDNKMGLKAFDQITTDFKSLADVIAHTHPADHGTNTVIDLPNHQTITLVNLSEKEIGADVKHIIRFLG